MALFVLNYLVLFLVYRHRSLRRNHPGNLLCSLQDSQSHIPLVNLPGNLLRNPLVNLPGNLLRNPHVNLPGNLLRNPHFCQQILLSPSVNTSHSCH